MRCICHQIFNITRIEVSEYLQLLRRYVQMNIVAWLWGAVNTLCMVGTTVHIAYTGGCALYLAPSLQYNAHRNVGISPIAAQIRLLEFWSLYMRSCNYIVYRRVYCPHSVIWRMCAVFSTKFAVLRALNSRLISNSRADTFSFILKP
jgi:hypothetical protein